MGRHPDATPLVRPYTGHATLISDSMVYPLVVTPTLKRYIGFTFVTVLLIVLTGHEVAHRIDQNPKSSIRPRRLTKQLGRKHTKLYLVDSMGGCKRQNTKSIRVVSNHPSLSSFLTPIYHYLSYSDSHHLKPRYTVNKSNRLTMFLVSLHSHSYPVYSRLVSCILLSRWRDHLIPLIPLFSDIVLIHVPRPCHSTSLSTTSSSSTYRSLLVLLSSSALPHQQSMSRSTCLAFLVHLVLSLYLCTVLFTVPYNLSISPKAVRMSTMSLLEAS